MKLRKPPRPLTPAETAERNTRRNRERILNPPKPRLRERVMALAYAVEESWCRHVTQRQLYRLLDRALIVKPPHPLPPPGALERLRAHYPDRHPWGADDPHLPQPGRPLPGRTVRSPDPHRLRNHNPMTTDSSTTTTNIPDTAGTQRAHPAPQARPVRHAQPAPYGPERPPICGEPAMLPANVVLTALRYAHRPDIGPDDVRDVRCTLQVHDVTEMHYGFIVDTDPTTGAWTRWHQDATPQTVLVLPDCPATEPGQDRACSEYEGHRDGHTWQVKDPWNSTDPL